MKPSTLMTESQILDRLQDDEFYYGEFGRQFLSASNIRSLISKPTTYGKVEKTLPLLEGRYFHLLMLEPERADTIPVVECSSRNTKAFKEYKEEHQLDSYDVLLQGERDQVRRMAEAMKSNLEIYERIYGEKEYEVPAITEIGGVMFKGKCDILGREEVIDLKTSSNVHKFRWSCQEYCYDSQAFIYQTLFGKPMVFIVIDKNTFELKISDCSSDFIERGKEKVEQAIKVYKKFYSDDATNNISNYIYKETL
jgi:hypothetical protein